MIFQYSNSEEGTFLLESRKVGNQSLKVGNQSPRTRQYTNQWVEDEVQCMPAGEKMNLLIIGTFAYRWRR